MTKPVVHRERVTGRGAWTSCDFRGKDDISFDLGPRHHAAIRDAMANVRRLNLAVEEIERRHFPLGPIADDLARLKDEIVDGRGVVVVRGFPVDEYDSDEIAKVLWGVGTHWGVAVSQSVMGDRLGHVIDVTDTDPNARAYRNRQELMLHTDLADIVSFLCLRRAESGGVTRIASALAVHNEILAAHPEYLEPLYRGYHWHRLGEHGPDQSAITPYPVPVLSWCDGRVSCRYVRAYINEATPEMGALSELEIAALDFFDEVARRPDVRFDFMLERGDAIVLNNLTVLHARTAFENVGDSRLKRHLVRLWLGLPNGHAVVPEIDIYASGRTGGIPRQEGRTPSFERRVPTHY